MEKQTPLRIILFLTLLPIFFLLFFVVNLSAQDFSLRAEVVNGWHVRISFYPPNDFRCDHIILYRSAWKISPDDLDFTRHPITEFKLTPDDMLSGFLDSFPAHNVTYYYLAEYISENQKTIFSHLISMEIPDVDLPRLNDPEIVIDKINYVLEVREKEKPVKRYPVGLGRAPIKRKLHQDFATTPEGIYRMTSRRSNSTFHRAYDINYPNELDRIRYNFMNSLKKVPEGKNIGGDIQIHGQLRASWSIDRNWTWGCISLRNEDIDELFNHKEIGPGTPVVIVGQHVSMADLVSMRKTWSREEIRIIQSRLKDLGFYSGQLDGIMGRQTRYALGRYQLSMEYLITCAFDERTLKDLLIFERLQLEKTAMFLRGY